MILDTCTCPRHAKNLSSPGDRECAGDARGEQPATSMWCCVVTARASSTGTRQDLVPFRVYLRHRHSGQLNALSCCVWPLGADKRRA